MSLVERIKELCQSERAQAAATYKNLVRAEAGNRAKPADAAGLAAAMKLLDKSVEHFEADVAIVRQATDLQTRLATVDEADLRQRCEELAAAADPGLWRRRLAEVQTQQQAAARAYGEIRQGLEQAEKLAGELVELQTAHAELF